MDTIGEKIRIQRTIKKFSQQYMAFMLDISQAAYSKIERAETLPSLPRIYAIAEILEISPFELMPKPKYDSAINLHAIYTLYFRLKKVIKNRLWRKKYGTLESQTSQSDISNIEPL
jgi:transcriptional regulator with XRE-family HTH domain